MYNVLLIDDDKNQLFLNTILLSEENTIQNVKTFQNPLHALDFLKQNFNPKNHIIVLDINMPQMNAWQLLDRFNTDLDNKTLNNLNLFIASHSANPKDIEKANKHDLVYKYIDKFELVEEVANFAKVKMPKRLSA